ncbi:GNAT family N-acetyltransferase [Ralstonia syzygii]|uniref:Conserved hypothethical protein,N-acyltransferase domain n=1 Tax=Ralstonia syzygii R24 TaxID=907261 RepID=G3A867_9RALS|nr:GNAT family N-acetyltransferase [Ralstonia syzygii]CCA86184.1 conserved hypothethical protein,N-acyltransferase domain [Ralstonia syzygii R24]
MSVTEDEVVFRPAKLLDIPSIYQLAQLGSVAGAYADAYLGGTGHVLLLKQLLAVCLLPWFSSASIGDGLSPLAVLECDEELLGFAWIQQAMGAGCPLVTVLMFSVAPEHAGKGYGQALLGNVVRRLPKGAIVRAECTRYASRMKALLRRAGFVRRKQSLVKPGFHGLDVYEKTIE